MAKHILSNLAQTLVPSEIVRLGASIKEKKACGAEIFNYTIGDFDSKIFPIPQKLEQEIIKAYHDGYTTYPGAEGELALRQSVSRFLKRKGGFDYDPSEILISAGGRPLIYAAYKTIVSDGDKVIYPVPSWNNNHYTNFNGGEHIVIETTRENNFLPTGDQIRPHVKAATLIAVCSPLNPSGTSFSKKELEDICDLILEENASRGEDEKKLYLLYDQMYWVLTFGETVHYAPSVLRPAMKDYTIYIDGISKAFAATGVRVGWTMAPQEIIVKMRGLNSHIGSWAPMAEQHAVANFLDDEKSVDEYLTEFKKRVFQNLETFHEGFQELKSKGYAVDSIKPMAAIYLTVQFDLVGKKFNGEILKDQAAVTEFLLDDAKLALVPFNCFGAGDDSTWYRLSVGVCSVDDIKTVIGNIENALKRLS